MHDSFYRFASLFPEPLLLVRADGGIAAANPKCLALLGLDSETFIGTILHHAVVERFAISPARPCPSSCREPQSSLR